MNKKVKKKSRKKSKGLKIATKLSLMFTAFIVVMAVALSLVYQQFVPPLMEEQIELRTLSVSRPLAAALLEPLAIRDYLRVNTLANVSAKLPGVAYIAVVSAKGKAAAGLYGDVSRFDAAFTARVKQEGFPINDLPKFVSNGETVKNDLVLGGKRVVETVDTVGSNGAVVRVGLFTEDVEAAVNKSLIPLLILLAVMGVIGFIASILIAKSIADPIKKLATNAHNISIGKMNEEIDVTVGGEVGELAQAFGRMQTAIKFAMKKLEKRSQ